MKWLVRVLMADSHNEVTLLMYTALEMRKKRFENHPVASQHSGYYAGEIKSSYVCILLEKMKLMHRCAYM